MGVSEELTPEVIAEIEAGYRLRPATQVSLFIVLALLGIWLITRVELPLDLQIVVATIYVALLYPLIMKMRNRITIAISFGLYGAALAAILYWLITKHVMPLLAAGQGIPLEALALYVIFMEIIGMELFHHLCEEFVFYERDWRSYLLVTVLSVIFFACLYVFLSAYALGFTALAIAAFLTIMFAWAVLPEKPI